MKTRAQNTGIATSKPWVERGNLITKMFHVLCESCPNLCISVGMVFSAQYCKKKLYFVGVTQPNVLISPGHLPIQNLQNYKQAFSLERLFRSHVP